MNDSTANPRKIPKPLVLICGTFSQMRKPEKKENRKKEVRLIARIEALNVFLLFYLAGMAGARAGVFDLFLGELWYYKRIC